MSMHSRWNGYEERCLLGCGVYPLRHTSEFTPSGPSTRMDNVAGEGLEDSHDIVDEALYLLKPHLLLRSFSIKGAGDRVLLYLTAYMHECLKMLTAVTREEAAKLLINHATLKFSSPGDKDFPFNSFFLSGSSSEKEEWQSYMRQLRVEASSRLVEKVFMFPETDGTGNRFWLAFAKRSFLSVQ
ncbi:putative ARP2 3 complex ARPC3 (21 kDa) subunit [Trypanosoma vivax]|uniref:Putative ARP2/3 complex subunit n=1 Tax=Trypanosoma vivax (strain Y486) TaxID=1055687 RepID=G0U6A2_TRYVY|nr:putative ARP2/3 complex subunit [Trypanosoma vivax]KAH8611596.1 putative ARP2 3 complex ARPC3 (21 kDa) subunit [Trypanosoma vivax]CCC51405.1 putative ARP2/3 complex subunit [Trypanosoma vivax Y486]